MRKVYRLVAVVVAVLAISACQPTSNPLDSLTPSVPGQQEQQHVDTGNTQTTDVVIVNPGVDDN